MELFRLVGREDEVNRERKAFSISHDQRAVRIYGHCPVITGKETAFYRHLIREFDFTDPDGNERWTAYRFTKNVYDIWMPSHWARIRSAIDDLPSDLDVEVTQLSEAGESGFSRVHG